MRILTVCLGNICRSPTAEAALREAAAERGVEVEVASAGTAAYHVGEPPDPRMRSAGRSVGLVLDGAAQQVTAADLRHHDLVLAMDRSNLEDLLELAGEGRRDHIRMFRSFADAADDAAAPDVPDPYYGGSDGFDEVVAIARRNARAVVAAIADGTL